MQCERDRCKSPSSRATALLAKVAVSPQPMASTPSAPRMANSLSNQSSTNTSPLSTPPGEGGHFPFGMLSKELPESPDGMQYHRSSNFYLSPVLIIFATGGYISFPVFEEFGEYKSEDGGSPPAPRER